MAGAQLHHASQVIPASMMTKYRLSMPKTLAVNGDDVVLAVHAPTPLAQAGFKGSPRWRQPRAACWGTGDAASARFARACVAAITTRSVQ